MLEDQLYSIKNCQETIKNVLDVLENNCLPDFNLRDALSKLNNIVNYSYEWDEEWWHKLEIGDTVRLSADETIWEIISKDENHIKVKSGQIVGVFSFPQAFELMLLEKNHE